MLRFIAQQRGSPEAIAFGATIGTFIAFSPTMGIQILLVLVVATLFRANRLAALIPIWITNVFTAPPIYAFTWKLGSFILSMKPSLKTHNLLSRTTQRIAEMGIFDFHLQIGEWLKTGWDIFLPLIIGGLVVGTIGAVITYPVTLWGVRRYRTQRSLRLQKRRATRITPPPQLDTKG